MTENPEQTYDVVIAGGGPAGLFLALCLHRLNLSSVILEQRAEPGKGSRSLGIHPVSLELFGRMGLAEQLIDDGIKIRKGSAYLNADKIGEISFDGCPPPYRFILSLPQYRTETILNRAVKTATGGPLLVRGAEVRAVSQSPGSVRVTYARNGETHRVSGRFLAGCDGKNSFIRKQSGSAFKGRAYPDTYIMGDFTDNTGHGAVAAIYLCDEGVIESLPLNGNRRRWVVKTGTYHPEVCREDIEKRVYARIGHNLRETNHSMLSSFGVQKYLADPQVDRRIILVGDAAHIVSPIGGQGMNLGWLDAWDLSHTLHAILHQKKKIGSALKKYERRRVKTAEKVMRRAEWNMRLGRRTSYPFLKRGLLRIMVNTPLSKATARLFTMRGLTGRLP